MIEFGRTMPVEEGVTPRWKCCSRVHVATIQDDVVVSQQEVKSRQVEVFVCFNMFGVDLCQCWPLQLGRAFC
jgi:hypothetical protein